MEVDGHFLVLLKIRQLLHGVKEYREQTYACRVYFRHIYRILIRLLRQIEQTACQTFKMRMTDTCVALKPMLRPMAHAKLRLICRRNAKT